VELYVEEPRRRQSQVTAATRRQPDEQRLKDSGTHVRCKNKDRHGGSMQRQEVGRSQKEGLAAITSPMLSGTAVTLYPR
jgi:hypothetical protein